MSMSYLFLKYFCLSKYFQQDNLWDSTLLKCLLHTENNKNKIDKVHYIHQILHYN